jgi:hypothetical protein
LNGYEGNIRNKFVIPDLPQWKEPQHIIGIFYKADLSTKHLIVDDKLPEHCDGGFLSFQPVNKVFLVPLLEKAMAKFVDAYPGM